MININQLSMAYGEKLLFYDVTLLLPDQKRYALVGANGAGKSTFFKLLMGTEEAIAGSVSIPKTASIGWLKQDQFRYETSIITDIVLEGKPKLWHAMQEKQKLLAANQWNEKSLNQFSKLEETITHLNGYSAEGLAEKILTGLGIHAEYHKKPLSTLSGGFKLRVLLAQALFQAPDILLLDEPTNHLDFISIQWLEQYLKNEFQGLLLFISHDVAFINRLADNILDVDYGEIRQYSGNYEKFLLEKIRMEEQKLSEKQHAELRISEMQRFVDKFRASSSRAKQAQSRLKKIEKIQIPDIKKSSRLKPHFNFNPAHRSGKMVLKVNNITKHFKNKKLFEALNFEIKRGEKVAIVGENGIGKSTLIKLLLGKIPADNGDFQWGYATQPSYFSQDHHDLLNEKTNVLDWLSNQVNAISEQTIRQVLAQLLFTKDDVQKNILAISGGEAARLLLAKLILESPNVLVLDEPTNHLDIEANDALANALKNYSGTLIFVSHDRHFINKIANRVLFISHHKKIQDVKQLDNINFS